MTRLRFLGAALLLLATALSAHATPDSEYRQHYEQARKLVRHEDRRGAIKEFEAAYAASPKPEALFNIGVIYHKLAEANGAVEDARRSLDSFEQYLERYRKAHGTEPPDVKTVERYIAELRERYALKEAEPEKPVAVAPAVIAPVAISAPPPPVVKKPLDTWLIAPGLNTAIAAPAPRKPAKPELTPAQKKKYVVGGVLLGLGVLVAGAGGTFMALGTATGNGADYTTIDNFNAHSNTFQYAGAALLGVGGAAIVAGIVTLVLPTHKDAPSKAIRLSATANGLLASGSF